MTLKIDDEWPEKLLRGWATSYRETPEYRFPSDPSAEFFPVDMEAAADEIERLRAIETAARALKFAAYPAHGSGFVITVTGGNINDLEAALNRPERC
jgi:hypothetical protein